MGAQIKFTAAPHLDNFGNNGAGTQEKQPVRRASSAFLTPPTADLVQEYTEGKSARVHPAPEEVVEPIEP